MGGCGAGAAHQIEPAQHELPQHESCFRRDKELPQLPFAVKKCHVDREFVCLVCVAGPCKRTQGLVLGPLVNGSVAINQDHRVVRKSMTISPGSRC